MGWQLIAVSPDAQIAQGFGALFVSNTGLFTGVLIRPANMPSFWKFMYWRTYHSHVKSELLETFTSS